MIYLSVTKIILISFISLIFLTLTPSAFSESVKILRFATEATYPPFEYLDTAGNIKGFDIEIASALCQQIKVECVFNHQSFSSLIPSLTLGKYDAVIAAMATTPEREKQVSFTRSYYEPSASFVGLIAKQYDLNHLTGKTVGVQQGTTFERYLYDKYNNKIMIKSYASIQEAFLDLNAERLDMVIADTPIVQAWLKQHSNLSNKFGMIDRPIIDHDYFGKGYAIAVNKKNILLLDTLNKALSEIKKNGVYKKISQHYFGNP